MACPNAEPGTALESCTPLGSYLPHHAYGSEQQCDRCHVFRFMVSKTGVGSHIFAQKPADSKR